MSALENLSPLELGRHLANVRERAGIKQAELARRVTWSPAVLSRIESGERGVAAEELDQLLEAIATPDAQKLRAALDREWTVLEQFLHRPGAAIAKRQIEDALYAFGAEIESNTVEVYVSRLRKKLGKGCVETLRGIGYRLGR